MKKCKSCQTEIDAKAKKCPHCQADQRNWPGRHPILTGLGVIIIIIIIASVAGNSGKSSSSSTSTGTNSSSAPAVQTETAKVGDTVNDGDLAFTVQSVSTSQSIGNSFTQQTAQGEFYILSVKIQNNGKDTKTINASDFNVVDNQGRKYDYSTDGQTAMEETSGATDFFLQQIQPSLSVTGKIVFDVPPTATGLKLMAQGDIFSNPVSIDLGK
jgi:RNA polymerase subunit RPABC4/transcription elongation factor Spt4